MTATQKNQNIRGERTARYPLFAAGGVEITEEHIGRKVRFKQYEGYQGQQTLEGVGEIVYIDFTSHFVIVKMPFKRMVYGRYSSDYSDRVMCSSSYDFGNHGRKAGCWLDHENHGYQFDYPCVWKSVFELVEEETSNDKT